MKYVLLILLLSTQLFSIQIEIERQNKSNSKEQFFIVKEGVYKGCEIVRYEEEYIKDSINIILICNGSVLKVEQPILMNFKQTQIKISNIIDNYYSCEPGYIVRYVGRDIGCVQSLFIN